MKNVSDTDAYTAYDVIFSKAVRSISNFVGVRKLTRPFWDRWRASNIGDDVIFRFLDRVGTIDNWASGAEEVVSEEIAAYRARCPGLDRERKVEELRRLSYLCNMAQWGSLPITDARLRLYRACRDFYVEAETLAEPERFRRLQVPWRDKFLHAHLHLPAAAAPTPLIVIVQGVEGCKEEHLATELSFRDAGFAVLGIDGPGQGEALLLDGIGWEADFPLMVTRALDALSGEARLALDRTGLFGISIGGMWALMAAAADRRVHALYDLGGPIHTRSFPRLPFLIKTRMCQMTGARTHEAIAKVLEKNSTETDAILSRVACAVRIMHGGRDRVVSTSDKAWLRDKLLSFGRSPSVSLEIIADDDHCCTGHFASIREDAKSFFSSWLR